MSTVPPDLYPHLVATFFQEPVSMVSSSDLTNRYSYTVTREEMRQCRRPTHASMTRLAGTCTAMRRAVKDAHTQDAHTAVQRWWRSVISTPLKFGSPSKHDVSEGMHRVFHEKTEIHRSASFDESTFLTCCLTLSYLTLSHLIQALAARAPR